MGKGFTLQSLNKMWNTTPVKQHDILATQDSEAAELDLGVPWKHSAPCHHLQREHLWLREMLKCLQYQLASLLIRKMNTLSWDWAKVNELWYVQNCPDTQSGCKKEKHVINNKAKFRSLACECSPILLQIVTRSSPTVLESSTITVFTDPSSIRIFWGLCFFLYSKIS